MVELLAQLIQRPKLVMMAHVLWTVFTHGTPGEHVVYPVTQELNKEA